MTEDAADPLQALIDRCDAWLRRAGTRTAILATGRLIKDLRDALDAVRRARRSHDKDDCQRLLELVISHSGCNAYDCGDCVGAIL